MPLRFTASTRFFNSPFVRLYANYLIWYHPIGLHIEMTITRPISGRKLIDCDTVFLLSMILLFRCDIRVKHVKRIQYI